VCIGSCDVAMCRWSTWPKLSSLAGFSTRSQALCCITVLSESLDLWHILMHWVTFRCVKVRTRVRRLSFYGLARAKPHGFISLVSNSTSDVNLFFVLCISVVLVIVPAYLHKAAIDTTVTGHKQTFHVWVGRSVSVTVGSTQRPWTVRKWQRRQSACLLTFTWGGRPLIWRSWWRRSSVKRRQLWTPNVICVQVWENLTNRRQKLTYIMYSVRVSQRTQFPSFRKASCI
jgi:hypothetical protein